jgi:hypothetical protein
MNTAGGGINRYRINVLLVIGMMGPSMMFTTGVSSLPS